MSGAGVVQVFLVGVAVTALLAGRASAALAAAASVLAFNFFFVEPLHTFAVADPENLLIFVVLLVAGLVLSELVARLRFEARSAEALAETQRVLLAVGTILARTRGVVEVRDAAEASITRELGRSARVDLEATLGATRTQSRTGHADAGAMGRTSVVLTGSAGKVLGLLSLEAGAKASSIAEPELVRALGGIVALALEREVHADEARRVAVEVERERSRSDLLSTVSHDLRTPLAAISSSVSALRSPEHAMSAEERAALLRQVGRESERLTRMVENLLNLGRLDEGLPPHATDLYPLQEIVEGALARITGLDGGERIVLDLPDDPLWIRVDPDLLVNALVNLLDNALRYAASGDVLLAGCRSGGRVEVSVEDRGPGFAGDPKAFVPRFVRGPDRRLRGSGLGLSICAAIARAHGGELEVRNLPAIGARAAVRLPAVEGVERSAVDAAGSLQ